MENNFGFPGQYYEEETGLYYNYFRDYDPSTGRYTTSDPIGLDGGLNTYLYVNANPLVFTDRKGLVPGDGLEPPGTCSWAKYVELRNNKVKACGKKRSCKGVGDCATARERLANGQECLTARHKMMTTCFRGGDTRHFGPIRDVIDNIQGCYDVITDLQCWPSSPLCGF